MSFGINATKKRGAEGEALKPEFLSSLPGLKPFIANRLPCEEPTSPRSDYLYSIAGIWLSFQDFTKNLQVKQAALCLGPEISLKYGRKTNPSVLFLPRTVSAALIQVTRYSLAYFCSLLWPHLDIKRAGALARTMPA